MCADIADVEEFQAGLDYLHGRIAARFPRAEVRTRVRRYLAALFGHVDRRNSWQMAEQLGEPSPRNVQRLLNGAHWDADAVRDDLQAYVTEHLGAADGVLIADETGFLKKGTKSVGVKRQYSGTAGRKENCQVGVFVAYASSRGRTLIDRALYLPQEWAEDTERRREAGVPPEVSFATKPELAQRMLQRARRAAVPAGWVTADSVAVNLRLPFSKNWTKVPEASRTIRNVSSSFRKSSSPNTFTISPPVNWTVSRVV